MARLYRQVADSSSVTGPRVLARVFPAHDALSSTVRFYEGLTGQSLDMDLDMRDEGMHLVAVGGFLLLDLDASVLDRIEVARQTSVTMIFADLDTALASAVSSGAELVTPPWPVLTGRAARIRHADGLLVEYLEHRPSVFDVDRPGL